MDFYLPTGEYHEAVHGRRRQLPLEGRPAWFLSAEDLAVFKMILYRPKDFADLEALLVVRGDDFDLPYVEDWLSKITSPHDLRVERWREIVQDVQEVVKLRRRESGVG